MCFEALNLRFVVALKWETAKCVAHFPISTQGIFLIMTFAFLALQETIWQLKRTAGLHKCNAMKQTVLLLGIADLVGLYRFTGVKHAKFKYINLTDHKIVFFRSKGYLNSGMSILKESKLPMVMKHVSSSRVSILQSF